MDDERCHGWKPSEIGNGCFYQLKLPGFEDPPTCTYNESEQKRYLEIRNPLQRITSECILGNESLTAAFKN